MRSIACLCLSLFFAFNVTAQNYGGGYRGAPGPNLHDALAQTMAQDEARRASNAVAYARSQAAQNFVPFPPWRVFNGSTNYVKAGGVEFCGRVMEMTPGGARIDGTFGPLFTTSYDPALPNHTSFIVTNLPPDLVRRGALPADQHFMAWPAGSYAPATGAAIAKLDYGVACAPPPPSPEQLAMLKARQDPEHQHWWLMQSNAVRSLSTDAEGGDAGAQYSLALHYLNGVGCETNREQAMYWLQKSAAQGYSEASNKLAVLQSAGP